VAAALCYGLAPFAPRLGPVAGSVALVVLAVLLAMAASGVAASLAVARGGGALAGTLSPSFALAPLPVRAVAVTVAAVLLALPLLVAADDPVAHALDGAGTDLDGTVGASLREAAELRRAV